MPESKNSAVDLEASNPGIIAAGSHAWRAELLRTGGERRWLDWLRDRGSLTARIQAHGCFAVHVLRQGLAKPSADEATALGLPPGRQAWIREVALHCDDRLVVFAHTVLPYRPRGPLTGWLARLGNRSLGAMLFSHAGFQRGPMTFRRLDARHVLYAPARQALGLAESATGTLWARRSYFSFGVQAVLVTEVFSPNILALPTDDRQSWTASGKPVL